MFICITSYNEAKHLADKIECFNLMTVRFSFNRHRDFCVWFMFIRHAQPPPATLGLPLAYRWPCLQQIRPEKPSAIRKGFFCRLPFSR
jgi:hypothetical protein